MATAAFKAWAAQRDTRKVAAIVWQPFRLVSSSNVTLYSATVGGYWDKAHYFEPNLKSVPVISQSMDSLTHGKSLPTMGNIEFGVEHGRTIDPVGLIPWDDLRYPRAFAFHGHPLEIRIGGLGLAWEDWAVIAGFMDAPAGQDAKFTLGYRAASAGVFDTQIPLVCYGDAGDFPAWPPNTALDLGHLLRPIAPNGNYFYEVTTAGTTGPAEPTYPTAAGATVASGTATLTCRVLPDATKGKPKPLPWGQCSQITPVLIDEASYLYQFGDDAHGPYQAVDAQYVNGAVVAIGTAYLAHGTIRFSSKPANTPTLDIKGRKPGGAYINLPGAVASDMLITLGGVPTADLVAADFAAYAATVPMPVGLYLTSKTSLGNALDSVFKALLTRCGTHRDGGWTVKRFVLASGAPVLELDDTNLLSWEESSPAAIIRRAEINADRVWTTNNNPDATLTQETKVRLAEQYRSRFAEDESIATIYPKADVAGPHDTLLVSLDDAATVAGWWLAIFGTERKLYTVTAKLQPLSVELGDVVSITRNRYGLQAGVLGVVVSVEETYGSQFKVKLGVLV